jgi:prepilin-type N-terminal cleavage/methylation domain-containing protein
MKIKAFTLIELMIVVAIIAIIATFAIPNLIRSKMVTNETGAVAGLKSMVNHEEVYKSSDADGNGIKDYLTNEIAGFYTTKDANGNEIKMIDVAFAKADFTDAVGWSMVAITRPSGAVASAAKAGYRFTTMDQMHDESNVLFDHNDTALTVNGVTVMGANSGLTAGAAGHTSVYGFQAHADSYGRSGTRSFIVNIEGSVYAADKGGTTTQNWPGSGDITTLDAGSGRNWSLAE